LVPRRNLSDRANGSVIAVTEGQKFLLRLSGMPDNWDSQPAWEK
jgi:hypothetical protein